MQTKSEIKQEQEDLRRELLEDAQMDGVQVVHVFNPERPKGGLTIAFRKHLPEHKSTNMVQLSVATCSTLDNFSRKTGTMLALQSFFNGGTIDLPLSSGYADEDLSKIVKDTFTRLYNMRGT